MVFNSNMTTESNAHAVPYRWGEGVTDSGDEREFAWYEYTLENDTRSTADQSYLDLIVDQVSIETGTDGLTKKPRGFLVKELQIDGYQRVSTAGKKPVITPDQFATNPNIAYEWTNRAGKISAIWIFGYNQTVYHDYGTHTTPESPPMAIIPLTQDNLEQWLGSTDKGYEGTLSLPLDQASLAPYMTAGSSWAPVKTVRFVYDTMNAELTVANGTAFTARLFGDVETHGLRTTVTSDQVTNQNSYNNLMSSTTAYYPLSSYYGHIERTTTTSVAIKRYDPVSQATAFKDGNFRPGGATSNSTNENDNQSNANNSTGYGDYRNTPLLNGNRAVVEVENDADGTGYLFTYRNKTLARSDNATITMRIDSVSMKAYEMLTGSYADDDLDSNGFYTNRGVVRGFKTARLDFGTALATMGTLSSLDLVFLQPNGKRFTKTLKPGDLAFESNGSLVLDFKALWDGQKVNDPAFGAVFANDSVTTNYTQTPYELLDCYLYEVRINYDTLEPSWRPSIHNVSTPNGYTDANADTEGKLTMKATGNTDWYNSVGNIDSNNNGYGTGLNCQSRYISTYTSGGNRYYSYNYPHDDMLHAQMFLTQKGVYDTRISENKCAALSVPRPAMEIHSYLRFGQQDYTEQVRSDSACSDGNRTEVTVPYAKTFTYWAQMRNQPRSGTQAYSTLDDSDVLFSFPIEFETNIRGAKANVTTGGVTTQAVQNNYTGFHAINYTIKKQLMDCFPDERIGKIRIVGKTQAQVKTVATLNNATVAAATSKIVLKPYYEGGVIAGFEIEKLPSGALPAGVTAKYKVGDRFPLQTNGDFFLTEKEVFDMGIEVPTSF